MSAAVRDQARAAVLAWQQTIESAWQRQSDLLVGQPPGPSEPARSGSPFDGLKDLLAGGLRRWGELDQRVWHGVGEIADDIVDGIAERGGDILRGLGNLMGNQDLVRRGNDFQAAGDADGDRIAEDLLARGADNRSALFQTATAIDGDKEPVTVIISRERYPESAAHIDDAQNGVSYRGGADTAYERQQPRKLTLDRDGAKHNRQESLRDVPPSEPGYDRDEYPPAMFGEGGKGASVLNISRSDNRGAGASMGNQLRYAPVEDAESSVGRQTRRVSDGETVIIVTE
jgi:hypothetical protein